jgi:LacI family transcriptional regulator
VSTTQTQFQFFWKILNEGYLYIDMTATLKDVAKLVGVHPSTVSRVIRGKENFDISAKTRDKIFRMVEKLNYQPDPIARALRLKKSQSIGIIIPNINSPYFAGIAKTISNKCDEIGYTLFICDTDEDQEKEIRAVNDLTRRGIDGLIIAPVQKADLHIRELAEKKFPFVIIDRKFNDFETNTIISNDLEVTYNTVKYLVSLGHKRIGFICGKLNLYPILRRIAGYKNAAAEFGLKNDDLLIMCGELSINSGFNSAIKLVTKTSPPTAIIVSGTIITDGVIKALIKRNISIPDNISLIAFTDSDYAPYLFQPITTITHLVEDIGLEALKLLMEHINSKENLAYSTYVLKCEVHLRKSIARISN